MPALPRTLFRLALYAQPAAMRQRFRVEMEQLFQDDIRAASRRGGWSVAWVSGLWFLDVLRSGLRERWSDAFPRPFGIDSAASARRRPGERFMDALRHDVRFALRSLRRRPGFTAIAVLTLALGIGATTAIWSVVEGVLLRSLPYDDASRLVLLWETDRRNPQPPVGGAVSPVVFKDWQAAAKSLESMAAFSEQNPTLTGMGEPEVVQAAIVTPDFFRVFRAEPVLGRALNDREDLPNGPLGVVVSWAFWQQRLGGDRSAVGHTLQLNGREHTIVGVAPRGFDYPSHARLWLAVRNNDQNCGRGCVYLNAVGRLAPGITLAHAQLEMHTLADHLSAEYSAVKNRGIGLDGLQETMVGDVRAALLVLLGAVGMVLLIACANVANLLIARGAGRGDELAVRVALGAGRRRIIAQLLTESLVLAGCGGALGIALAGVGIRALPLLARNDIPRLGEVGLHGTALLFAVGLTVLTAFLFGFVPALQLARALVAGTLREHSGRTAGSRRGFGRGLLLIAEVALSLMLLVGAGLLLRSFAAMQRIDPGFAVDGIARFSITLSQAKYPNPDQAVGFADQLKQRLQALPGVRQVAIVVAPPLSDGSLWSSLRRTDRPAPEPGTSPLAALRIVDENFFSTLDVAVLAGRAFTAADRNGALPVAIVNRKLAERLFPGEDPLGKPLALGVAMGYREPDARTIVGVIEDVRTENLKQQPSPEVYVPFAQSGASFPTFLLRTANPASALASVPAQVHALDPDMPVRDAGTLSESFNEQNARPAFYFALLALFATLAVALAAVGLYGVVAFLVAQRQREIGVRIALGASAGRVVRMVIREGLAPSIIGATLGLGAALAGARVLGSLLFELQPTDPLTYAGATVLLLAVVFLACLVPAGRATRIPPASALRTER